MTITIQLYPAEAHPRGLGNPIDVGHSIHHIHHDQAEDHVCHHVGRPQSRCARASLGASHSWQIICTGSNICHVCFQVLIIYIYMYIDINMIAII